MIIGSISENIDYEKRVAITPDVVKKYKSLGLEVHISKNYAVHLGIDDNNYISEGASIFSNEEILLNSNAIVQMNILNDEYLNKLKKKQILIGVLNIHKNEQKLKGIISKEIHCFATNMLCLFCKSIFVDRICSICCVL